MAIDARKLVLKISHIPRTSSALDFEAQVRAGLVAGGCEGATVNVDLRAKKQDWTLVEILYNGSMSNEAVLRLLQKTEGVLRIDEIEKDAFVVANSYHFAEQDIKTAFVKAVQSRPGAGSTAGLAELFAGRSSDGTFVVRLLRMSEEGVDPGWLCGYVTVLKLTPFYLIS